MKIMNGTHFVLGELFGVLDGNLTRVTDQVVCPQSLIWLDVCDNLCISIGEAALSPELRPFLLVYVRVSEAGLQFGGTYRRGRSPLSLSVR